ncbi:hypothetical protein KBY93_12885 [Synechococcus sp. J7-Johnson]|uniref:hypothetical protein n=1 Tax=Synechococcus sp. J7-Johnson TaxID=2823737 RepID=UPI0020CF021C|nr:hypothetical protein [Synechococcus sp. J7-Johnson]MCP9841523.1 hypothetical protein [Synechococcus sp. J7-Johnson]
MLDLSRGLAAAWVLVLLLKPVLVASLGSLLVARLLNRQSIYQRLIPPETSLNSSGRGVAELPVLSVPLRPRQACDKRNQSRCFCS